MTALTFTTLAFLTALTLLTTLTFSGLFGGVVTVFLTTGVICFSLTLTLLTFTIRAGLTLTLLTTLAGLTLTLLTRLAFLPGLTLTLLTFTTLARLTTFAILPVLVLLTFLTLLPVRVVRFFTVFTVSSALTIRITVGVGMTGIRLGTCCPILTTEFLVGRFGALVVTVLECIRIVHIRDSLGGRVLLECIGLLRLTLFETSLGIVTVFVAATSVGLVGGVFAFLVRLLIGIGLGGTRLRILHRIFHVGVGVGLIVVTIVETFTGVALFLVLVNTFLEALTVLLGLGLLFTGTGTFLASLGLTAFLELTPLTVGQHLTKIVLELTVRFQLLTADAFDGLQTDGPRRDLGNELVDGAVGRPVHRLDIRGTQIILSTHQVALKDVSDFMLHDGHDLIDVIGEGQHEVRVEPQVKVRSVHTDSGSCVELQRNFPVHMPKDMGDKAEGIVTQLTVVDDVTDQSGELILLLNGQLLGPSRQDGAFVFPGVVGETVFCTQAFQQCCSGLNGATHDHRLSPYVRLFHTRVSS